LGRTESDVQKFVLGKVKRRECHHAIENKEELQEEHREIAIKVVVGENSVSAKMKLLARDAHQQSCLAHYDLRVFPKRQIRMKAEAFQTSLVTFFSSKVVAAWRRTISAS
jgi:hypothetical protein